MPNSMNQPKTGYSKLSILTHWIGAICVVALFVTHEGQGAGMKFHVAGGAVLGVFLIWRVVRRILKGSPPQSGQHPLLNILSKLVFLGLLLAIFTVVITGYFLPWSRGMTIDIYGLFSLPSPMLANHSAHEFFEELHDLAGHALIPLTFLHIIGALKHRFVDKDQIMQRMVKSQKNGY